MPDDELHVYETRYGKLCVGVPVGQHRPALWFMDPISGQPRMLGRLDGDAELRTLVVLLDGAFDEINRVITHLKRDGT